MIFNFFPNKTLVFTYLHYKSFVNTVEKGEIAHNEQFLLFPQCFPLFGELSAIFIKSKIVDCILFHSGSFLRFFVWKRDKALSEKEIMLVNSIFSFFHNVFYPSFYTHLIIPQSFCRFCGNGLVSDNPKMLDMDHSCPLTSLI